MYISRKRKPLMMSHRKNNSKQIKILRKNWINQIRLFRKEKRYTLNLFIIVNYPRLKIDINS